MTKKQFTNVNHEIWQNGEWWCSAGGEHCADVIATALNEQHETITRLKKRFDSCSHNWALMYDEARNKVEKLSKENKQLKLQNQRLYIDIKNNQLAYYDLLNENEQLENENQKLDEKICLLTGDLIKTKSYEQLEKELNRIKNENEGLKSENEDMRRLINNISHQRDEFHHGARENANRVGKLKKENEQLKQRIKSRLHYYRELANEFDKDDGFTYNIVKRIVEDLEDILK